MRKRLIRWPFYSPRNNNIVYGVYFVFCIAACISGVWAFVSGFELLPAMLLLLFSVPVFALYAWLTISYRDIEKNCGYAYWRGEELMRQRYGERF